MIDISVEKPVFYIINFHMRAREKKLIILKATRAEQFTSNNAVKAKRLKRKKERKRKLQRSGKRGSGSAGCAFYSCDGSQLVREFIFRASIIQRSTTSLSWKCSISIVPAVHLPNLPQGVANPVRELKQTMIDTNDRNLVSARANLIVTKSWKLFVTQVYRDMKKSYSIL